MHPPGPADHGTALGAACPEWIYANAGMAGYFRVGLTEAQIGRVLSRGSAEPAGEGRPHRRRARLSSPVETWPRRSALALAPDRGPDTNRHVLQASVSLVESVKRHVPEALYPRYAAFVRDLYGPRARALGWKAAPTEDEDTRLLRRALVRAVGGLGDDAGPRPGSRVVDASAGSTIRAPSIPTWSRWFSTWPRSRSVARCTRSSWPRP